jgi:hypothetical protein
MLPVGNAPVGNTLNFLSSLLFPHHAISTYLHPKFFYVFTRNLGSTPMQLQTLEHWTSTPPVLDTRNLGSTPRHSRPLEHWTSTPHVLYLFPQALSRVSPARPSASLSSQIFLSNHVALQIILSPTHTPQDLSRVSPARPSSSLPFPHQYLWATPPDNTDTHPNSLLISSPAVLGTPQNPVTYLSLGNLESCLKDTFTRLHTPYLASSRPFFKGLQELLIRSFTTAVYSSVSSLTLYSRMIFKSFPHTNQAISVCYCLIQKGLLFTPSIKATLHCI